MKAKILLTIALALALTLVLAFSVFAEDSVHEGKVDLDATVTVGNQELALFDSEGNALIWYISGTEEDGTTPIYSSIRADIGIDGESKVDFQINNWASTINGAMSYQVDKIIITANGTEYSSKDIVVFNIMDDDVKVTTSKKANAPAGSPVNCLTDVFSNSANIQYAYLRLDTVAIQAKTFYKAPNLKYVNIADLTLLNNIAGENFTDCTSLFAGMELDLTKTSVIAIGNGAFSKAAMTGLKLPATLTSIGSYPFQYTPITYVEFNGPFTVSGDNHFKQCTSLVRVIGFDNYSSTTLAKQMFSSCSSLKEISIPTTITQLGDGAFYGCSSLASFDIHEGITRIGSTCFVNCSSLESVHIPASVSYIGSDCWKGCNKITTVTFDPDCQVTHIYAHTFSGAAITELTLPNSVQQVGQNAFTCSNLVTINLGAGFVGFNASNAGQPPFTGANNLKYIYVGDAFLASAIRDKIITWNDNNANEYNKKYVDLTIFYAGTKEQAEAIIDAANGGTTGTPVNTYFGSMIAISQEEYESAVANGTLETGVSGSPRRYIVYGYNKCKAFYNNEHMDLTDVENSTCQEECGRCHLTTIKASPVHQYVFTETFADTRFFSSVNLSSVCEDCATVEFDETLSAPFNWVGYSAKTFGDAKGFGQQYVINQDALTRYIEVMTACGKKFSYGVVAAGTMSAGQPLEIVEGVVQNKEGAQSICFDQLKYDAFFMNITGIDDANLDANLVCCAYVQLGEEIVYLDDNQAKDTAGFLTYNMIAMPETKEDEE